MFGSLAAILLKLISPFRGVSTWWASQTPERKKVILSIVADVLLILAIIAAGLYARHCYDVKIQDAYSQGHAAGVAEEQAKRKEELEKLQKVADTKLAAVQGVADKAAQTAQDAQRDLESRLNESDKRLAQLRTKLNTTVYDAAGNTLICYQYKAGNGSKVPQSNSSAPVDDQVKVEEIHLGTNFSDEWNRINSVANESISK